jgi:hypothetical protein
MIGSLSARAGLGVANIDVPIRPAAIDARGWTHCLRLLNSGNYCSMNHPVIMPWIFISRAGSVKACRIMEDACRLVERVRRIKKYNLKGYRAPREKLKVDKLERTAYISVHR